MVTKNPITLEEQQYNIMPESVTGVKPTTTSVTTPAPVVGAEPVATSEGLMRTADKIRAARAANTNAMATAYTPGTLTPAPEVATPVKQEEKKPEPTVLPNATVQPIQPKVTENTMDTTTEAPIGAKGVQDANKTQPVVKPVGPVEAQNEDEAFATIMGGGQLADTKLNSGFKASYNQFNALNGLDDKTLGTKISSGDVTPRMMNLLARYNPALLGRANEIAKNTTIVNDINTNAQNLYNTANGIAKTATPKASEQMMQDLVNGIETVPQKYSDLVAEAYASNPQIKEKSDKLAVIDDKIDTLDTEIDQMYDTYRSQYPTLPKGILIGMVNSANKALTNQRNSLVKESKLLYAQYKDEKDQIDQGIEYDIAQQEKLDNRKFELQKILYGDKKEEEVDLRELAQAEEVIRETRKYDEKKADEMELLNIQKAIANIGLTPVPGANYDTLLKQFASGMSADKQYERKQAELAASESRRKIIPNVKPGEMFYVDGKFVQAPQTEGAGPITTTRLSNGKEVTMGANAAVALDVVIQNNPSIKIDYNNLYRTADDQMRLYGKGRTAEQLAEAGVPAEYARPKESQVTWTLQSNHMSGKAFDVVGDKKYIDSIEPEMNAAGFFRPAETIKLGDYGHFEYVGKKSDEMSERQYTQFNQRVNSFKAEPLVKSFETALSAGSDILVSLKSENGPGDVGAVFSFMKSLDPDSVVKEGEFQLAAKSAGVYEQFKNIPANKLEGVILTPEQRKAFGKLAQEYIKGKAKLYDIKYDDMAKVLRNQGITDVNLPTRMSDFIEPSESQPAPRMTPQYIRETQQEIDEAIANGEDLSTILIALGDNADLFDFNNR